jgi:hypothetical protein
MRLSLLNAFGMRLAALTKPARLTKDKIELGISVNGKLNVFFLLLPPVAHRWWFNKRFSDVKNY